MLVAARILIRSCYSSFAITRSSSYSITDHKVSVSNTFPYRRCLSSLRSNGETQTPDVASTFNYNAEYLKLSKSGKKLVLFLGPEILERVYYAQFDKDRWESSTIPDYISIAHLPLEFSKEEILSIFTQFGPVKLSYVEELPRIWMGFFANYNLLNFLQFESPESATKAVEYFSKNLCRGYRLRVRIPNLKFCYILLYKASHFPMRNTIYIQNLPKRTDIRAVLIEEFSKFGLIQENDLGERKVWLYQRDLEHTGDAWVTFSSIADRDKAIEYYKDHPFREQMINVCGYDDYIQKLKGKEKYTPQILPESILVRGLPASIDNTQKLTDMFSIFGSISKTPEGLPRVWIFKRHGISRGDAVVNFENCYSADEAVKHFESNLFNGKKLTVQYATRENQPVVFPRGLRVRTENELEDSQNLTKLLDTIYVTGLPENVDLNTLYYYFSIPGPIKFNPDTGKPFVWVTLDNSIRGQPMKRAFIAYHTTKAAYEAVKYFEENEFDGVKVQVKLGAHRVTEKSKAANDETGYVMRNANGVYVSGFPSSVLSRSALGKFFTRFGECIDFNGKPRIWLFFEDSGKPRGDFIVYYKTPQSANDAASYCQKNGVDGHMVQEVRLLSSVPYTRMEQKQDPPKNTIYLEELPYNLRTTEALVECFKQFGEILKHDKTGKPGVYLFMLDGNIPRGDALVVFKNDEDAERAIKHFKDHGDQPEMKITICNHKLAKTLHSCGPFLQVMWAERFIFTGKSDVLLPGDWRCSHCNTINFAWRQNCFFCSIERAYKA